MTRQKCGWCRLHREHACLTLSEGRGFRNSFSGGSDLGSQQRTASEGLTGAGGPASSMTDPMAVGMPAVWSSPWTAHNVASASDPRRARNRAGFTPDDLASNTTCHPFQNILLATQTSSAHHGRNLCLDMKSTGLEYLRAILGAGYDSLISVPNGSHPSHMQNILTSPQGASKSHSVQ